MQNIHCLGLILAFIILLASPSADAESWSCTAVNKKAVLGYDGGSSVNVEKDTSNKKCGFSIGGASTDGKSPPGAFRDAINMVLQGQYDSTNFGSGHLVALVAGPFLDPSWDISSHFMSNFSMTDVGEVQSCISGFLNNRHSFAVDRNNITCDKSGESLVIAIQFNKKEYSIYLTRSLFDWANKGGRF